MDIIAQTHLPLAAGDNWIGIVAFIVIAVAAGVIKSAGKIRDAVNEAREQVRLEQQRELEREQERRTGRPPVQRPMQAAPLPSQTGGLPPVRDFGGEVLTPSTFGGQSGPVRRPAPAPQRPVQRPPVQRTPIAPTPAAANEPPQAVVMLKQVDQQIGVLEGNLAKLQARRAQLSALAGVRTRQPLATATTTAATPLNLNLRNKTNVRQGIVISELLRPPVGLREEESSWAK